MSERSIGLDLMRSFAILLVIYDHGLLLISSILNPTFRNISDSLAGYFGVELFFTLSGYLIGSIFFRTLFGEGRSGLKSLTEFWARRWLRTLPNYYLTLLILLVFLYTNGRFVQLEDILSYTFFVQNLFTFRESILNNYLGISWSLAIEEWFYLLFPPLMFFLYSIVKREGIIPITLITSILICNWIKIIGLSNGVSWSAMGFIVIYRFDSILWGVFMAYLYTKISKAIDLRNRLLMLSGLTIIIIVSYLQIKFVLTSAPSNEIGTLILGLTPIGYVLLIPFFKNLKSSAIKWNKVTFLISSVSYSWYLNHLLVLVVLEDNFHTTTALESLALFFLFISLSFSISVLQYSYWERLFLRYRDRNFPG